MIDEKEVSFGLPSIGIPAEVLFHPSLSQTEKLLFGFLRNLSQYSKGCWASNRWLGMMVGAKNTTISSAISNLQQEGFLIVEFAAKPGSFTQETERHIWIDPGYPVRYRAWVAYVHDCLDKKEYPNPDAFSQSYPPTEKPNGGYRKTGWKEVKEEVIESKDFKTLSLHNENPVEEFPKSRRTTPPIIEEIPRQLSAVQKRNQELSPIASQLSDIVQSRRNVKIYSTQIMQWSNEIRLLCDKNGINPARVKRALEWYADHNQGEYALVIESGAALREKFLRLEAQMEKDHLPQQPKQSVPVKPSHSHNDRVAAPGMYSGKTIKMADLRRKPDA